MTDQGGCGVTRECYGSPSHDGHLAGDLQILFPLFEQFYQSFAKMCFRNAGDCNLVLHFLV